MRKSLIFVFIGLLALSFAALIGCGDDDGGAAGTGGSGGSGGTAGTGGTACGTDEVAFSVELVEWNPATGEFTKPIDGVEICQLHTDYCVTTNAEGTTSVCLLVGDEVVVTMKKEGYQSYLIPGVVPPTPFLLKGGMSTNKRIEEMHGLMMSPYPMGATGDIVILGVDTGAFPGATLELEGSTTGKGFYYDLFGNWDPELSATTSYTGGPWGGFTEVSPGEVQVSWGGTAADCVIFRGWPGDTENSMRLPIMAGFLTQADVTCPGQ
jgi:hypothetical protein